MIPFFELKPGANYLRIIGLPWLYRAHSDFVLNGDPVYGQKIKCLTDPNDFIDERCFFCLDDLSSNQWIIPVLNNETKVYLFNCGLDTFGQLKTLATHPIWGNLQNYLIDIQYKFDYDKMKANISVIPCYKTPLHRDELELKTNLDTNFLQKLTDPPDQVYRDKLRNVGYYNPIKKMELC